MNKFTILGIALVVLIGGGVIYKFFIAEGNGTATGVLREIVVTIPKNGWTFVPETIDVNRGDTVKLTFVNEDDYDHGVGIDAYGVAQRIPARATLSVPAFTATKSGDFQFYCSVSCGDGVAESGPYKGEQRGHFQQVGMLCVHEKEGDRACVNTFGASDAVRTIPPAPAVSPWGVEGQAAVQPGV